VELEVEPGEFVAVTGPSGCGKSTLLNIVAGLEVADEGAVSIASDEITGRSETELALLRRKHVGMVFQFYNLLDELSVTENVALPAMLGGRKRKLADARARDLLGLLGLADRRDTSPAVLSGGQRQRLAIARALATTRHSSSPTSPPAHSTPTVATRSPSCSAGSTPMARRSSW